jgi:hypothetical protein
VSGGRDKFQRAQLGKVELHSLQAVEHSACEYGMQEKTSGVPADGVTKDEAERFRGLEVNDVAILKIESHVE